jgi:plasmid stability protein
MATLYVENVPDDVYEALRKHAKSQRRSIAAEVLALLEQFYPTEQQLKRRRIASAKLRQLRFTSSGSQSQLPTAVEMIREDRER